MKCNNCEGKLRAVDSLYICDNCGAKQTIASFFENTEVFISYIESDMQGRRTRDSIIAQDLYNKLQEVGINTFYKRISVEDLTAQNESDVCSEIINKAKVIIMVGTNRDVFDELINETRQFFNSKMVIPVYSTMSVADLPGQISNLQAMNYDTIGSSKDLQKNILSVLGREPEIDILNITNARIKRKKKIAFVTIGTVLLIITALASYYVFGTPYVLKSKKYTYAENLIEQKNYIEAIDILTNLGDYKNAQNELKNIYNKYTGYFINEDSTLNLYLYIKDNSYANIELRFVNDSMVKTNVSAIIEKDVINFEYEDNWGNNGVGVLKLQNNGIRLSTKTNEQSNVSFGNIEYLFSLENKTDAPIDAPITKKILMQLLQNPTTIEDLEKKGYELESVDYNIYKIKNTDILCHLYSADEQQSDSPHIVFRISGPANIILPDKVGTKFEACEKDDFFYTAGYNIGDINGMNAVEDTIDNTYSGTLTDTTKIIFFYKKSSVFRTSWFDYYDILPTDKRIIGEDDTSFYLIDVSLEDNSSNLPLMSRENREGYITLYRMTKNDFILNEIFKEHLYDISETDNINMILNQYSKEHNLTLNQYY